MRLGKKALVLVFVATISLSLFAGMSLAAGPGPDPITVILNTLRGVDANVTRVESKVDIIDNTVEGIDSTVDSIDNKGDNALMEQVITRTLTTTYTGGAPPLSNTPDFTLKCNRPWNLLAVYMTTTNMNGSDNIHIGYWRLGPRVISDFIYVIDTNVTDFPVLPSDMIPGTSMIAVAPNVEYYFGWSSVGTSDSFTTTFKIIIQRPTDSTFTYILT